MLFDFQTSFFIGFGLYPLLLVIGEQRKYVQFLINIKIKGMNFKIEKYDAHGIIKEIGSGIKKSSRTDCLEEILELPKNIGTGKIVGFSFSDGISLLIFNCSLKDDWSLTFENDSPAPLQFNFAVKGSIKHCFHKNRIRYKMNPLQGTITAHSAGSSQIIKFEKDSSILFTTLFIDRREYSNKIACMMEQMPQELKDIFLDEKAERSFFYQSNYSISIATCIQKITEDKNVGLVRSTLLEGKALELFSKQIEQYNADIISPVKGVILRKDDLEKIKQAKEIIISDLVNPPKIEELAKLVGINRQKLKQGFKKVYAMTINNYLRAERMEMASILLMNGKSVREAANEVGYINQSHFAKRFKEKYGILPRDYLKTIQLRNN